MSTASVPVSHSVQLNVGIRTVTTSVDSSAKGRVFEVNQRRVFLQGGNWITPDAMFAFSANPERYFDEVWLHREAGLNLIRVWGGGVSESDHFYEAADELGMLVLQEVRCFDRASANKILRAAYKALRAHFSLAQFWMSGDNNGRWGGDYDYPADKVGYLEAAEDVVLRLRAHASLLFWCGGNELWAEGGGSPPAQIQEGLRNIMAERDAGRFLIMSSMDGGLNGLDMDEHDEEFALAVKDGPYGFLFPSQYWAEVNPGMANGSTVEVGFQPEVGASSFPRAEGFEKFIPGGGVPAEGASELPPHWDFHK